MGDGLTLRGLRIIAAVRCAPPGNQPTVSERATCAPCWTATSRSLRPPFARSWRWAVWPGRASLGAACRLGWQVPAPKPTFGHGAMAQLREPGGRVVRLVGSYHVSQQNTFTGRLTEVDAGLGAGAPRVARYRSRVSTTPTPVLAVTVLGDDRPGIVAEVTAAVAGLGGNLEDSTMTLLRGTSRWSCWCAPPCRLLTSRPRWPGSPRAARSPSTSASCGSRVCRLPRPRLDPAGPRG